MTTRGLRWIGVTVAFAVLAASGLISMYVTEAGPFGDQVEPLACQNLAESESLPAAKREILRLGCEASKAARASTPQVTSPVVPPSPKGTPAPLPPCDQWDPSTSPGGCRQYGVLESGMPPPGYERILLMTNLWAGPDVIVYAGSLFDDNTQGVLEARQRDAVSPVHEYRTSSEEGALRIVRTEGNLLSLVTATSTEYTFDVDSMVLTPK